MAAVFDTQRPRSVYGVNTPWRPQVCNLKFCDMEDKSILPPDQPVSAPLRFRASRRKLILVVHDDADLRQLSASILMRSGFLVDTAADGATAWEALNTVSYDLLVTDFEMPNVSGVEFQRKLYAVRRALPVIVASPDLPRRDFPRNPWLQPAVTLLMPYTVGEFLGTVKVLLSVTQGARLSIPPPPDRKNWPSINGWQL